MLATTPYFYKGFIKTKSTMNTNDIARNIENSSCF